MSIQSIKLNDFLSFNSGVTPDEAEPIYAKIVEFLQAGDKVVLDFANVNMMTTAFLNVMIGTLYKDYNSQQLKSILSFTNLPDSVAIRIKKVADNAKLYYSDEEKYNSEVEEVMHETD